jgi:hypothetical protein
MNVGGAANHSGGAPAKPGTSRARLPDGACTINKCRNLARHSTFLYIGSRAADPRSHGPVRDAVLWARGGREHVSAQLPRTSRHPVSRPRPTTAAKGAAPCRTPSYAPTFARWRPARRQCLQCCRAAALHARKRRRRRMDRKRARAKDGARLTTTT